MSWYEEFFDERYLRFYPGLIHQPVATEEGAVIARLLELEDGAKVLDLGCGTGRHSVALARRGMRVTGLDLSPHLLAQARTTAGEHGAEVSWIERDMRDIDDLGPFDACVSLYTAFGFLGDGEDQEVLRQVAAALRPAGRFLLDLTNFLGYLRRFPPEVWRETGEAVTRERNTYDAASGVLITQRTAFFADGGRLELPESHVRAYLPHEVSAMLRRAGLVVEKILGALAEDAPFSWAESPNQVYLCRRP
jgi:SAM-dependent methyltransferase